MPGKRDLTFYNKTERPWFNRLDRSSIVGHTTSSFTKLWFRLKSEGRYLVAISSVPLKKILTTAPLYINDQWTISNHGAAIPLVALIPFEVTGETDFTCTIVTNDVKHKVDPQDINKTINEKQDVILNPDTTYYYALYNPEKDAWELGAVKNHTFKTLPVEKAGAWDITFGFYSCHMPFDPKSQSKADASMWALMEKELRFSNARFVIGGGDQVYSDGTDYLNIWSWLRRVKDEDPSVEDMQSWYRDIYRGYWGFPDVQAVHRQFPNYMVWDDHEIMDGWGSYKKQELSDQLDTHIEWNDIELDEDENTKKNLILANRMFDAAKRTYYEYQHAHNPDTPEKQFDFSFSGCGADYFFLDMRGERDFDRKNNAILGSEQHKRLKKWAEELDDKKSTPIFIVSTVPLVHLKDFVSNLLDWLSIFGARDDVRDHWAHDRHSKEFIKLLTTIFDCSERTGRPVVVMCGDVHIGGIFEIFSKNTKYKRARVFQVTSSAITYAALGPLKLSLLAKAVAKSGDIGCYEYKNKPVNSGFRFINHLVFPQYNFALIRYKSDAIQTTHIEVELVGKSEDSRVKESQRLNLLDLPRKL